MVAGHVLIPAESFMEKDHDKQSHWIPLAPGMAIQALLAERDGKQRVYVVSEETPSVQIALTAS